MREQVGIAACPIAGLVLAMAGAPAFAATIAGVEIPNRAEALARIDARDERIGSNQVVDRVAEVLDVALTAEDMPQPPPGDDGKGRPPAFLLRNPGNGHEAYRISLIANDGGAPRTLAIDGDGDGRFDPARDAVLRADDVSPSLAPGATLRLFVLPDPRGGAETGFTIQAAAVTGDGPAGTLFAGRGDGGGDAVIGMTTARAAATLAPSAAAPAATLVKSQRIETPDGSALPVRGATIRYTIEARVAPGASLPDARIVDPLPAGTRYVAGSLTLDGAPLSDAADDDAGLFGERRIEVALGPLAARSTHTVAFAVTIE